MDLFKTSDAMVHDSGSFSVEYHFTGKPVLFTTRDLDASLANQNELGREGIRAHYIGRDEQDIVSFIEDAVLGGRDPRKAVRTAFIDTYLRPAGNGSVAEIIYHDLLSGLGFNG